VTRYGVVDIGSNGIRMILAEVRAGQLQILAARREHVRLGEDVYQHGEISEDVMAAVVAATRGFCQDFQAASVQQTRAIATAATREASNRDQLVARVKQAAGIDVEVISGDREVWLLGLAVQGQIDLGSGRSLLLDLGGGSIELGTVDGGNVRGASLPLGALRLLRKTLDTTGSDSGQELIESLGQQIEAQRDELSAVAQPPFQRYVAVGGSIETLGDLAKQDGDAFDRDGVLAVSLATVRAWQARLAQLPPPERQARYHLPPERVDTIVPAAMVTTFVGELANVEDVRIPRVDLRHGLLRELAGATLATGDGSD
jgi:exopolyphosphatase/guanosine-5'-triphosphate,3'-diphosphate pyrophosphatase